MTKRLKHTGLAIAIAWPETLCKQAGGWYDPLLHALEINKEGYYKVGHAAVLLIDPETKEVHYFDFGRYHAPPGFGRVRSSETDHDLTIDTKAILHRHKLEVLNLVEILSELYQNPSTHGSGAIYGSPTPIIFDKALKYAMRLQEKEFIAYGPLQFRGSNCSRFVSDLILSGKPSLHTRLKLYFPLTISPTPMGNLSALKSNSVCVSQNIELLDNVIFQTAII
jgi:hypothetical protein